MKKNLMLIISGVVSLLFVICIGYVFTKPSQNSEVQQVELQEQDASSLSETMPLDKTPSSPISSTDSLVFNANSNTNTITTPPEKVEPELPVATQKENPTTQKTATAIEDKKEDIQKEAKAIQVLQDKLPVPFVEDSLKTRSVLAPKKNVNTIIYAELLMDGNKVGLILEGDKPIKPKTFRLQNPDRVVVDIEGYWKFKVPQLISNRMVKEIRANAQKDKTRIVFDLKVPATSALLYRIHSRKYQLVFK